MRIPAIATLLILAALAAAADEPAAIAPAEVERTVAAMFRNAPAELQPRLLQDETQQLCSQFHDDPPEDVAEQITATERSAITYPADGTLLGDWRRGAGIAEAGGGGQFSDDPGKPNGGNCYACHEMATAEVAYGTLGPSLKGYGRRRNFEAKAVRAAYARIFDAQSVHACSSMPRFGYHKFLTIEQIKDLTAYLMSPDSPVNN